MDVSDSVIDVRSKPYHYPLEITYLYKYKDIWSTVNEFLCRFMLYDRVILF